MAKGKKQCVYSISPSTRPPSCGQAHGWLATTGIMALQCGPSVLRPGAALEISFDIDAMLISHAYVDVEAAMLMFVGHRADFNIDASATISAPAIISPAESMTTTTSFCMKSSPSSSAKYIAMARPARERPGHDISRLHHRDHERAAVAWPADKSETVTKSGPAIAARKHHRMLATSSVPEFQAASL